MAKNTLRLDGLDQLFEALRQLPPRLAQEGSNIVQGAASGAYGSIYGKYPVGPTGNLRKMLKLTPTRGATGAAYRLINRAPHAAIWEFGTVMRETKKGWDRGYMRPGNVFIPEVIKHRRQMYLALTSMVARNGLVVSGSEDAAA